LADRRCKTWAFSLNVCCTKTAADEEAEARLAQDDALAQDKDEDVRVGGMTFRGSGALGRAAAAEVVVVVVAVMGVAVVSVLVVVVDGVATAYLRGAKWGRKKGKSKTALFLLGGGTKIVGAEAISVACCKSAILRAELSS
jgi:hypothetical protein